MLLLLNIQLMLKAMINLMQTKTKVIAVFATIFIDFSILKKSQMTSFNYFNYCTTVCRENDIKVV